MYNRYIPNNASYERIPDRDNGGPAFRQETRRPPPPSPPKGKNPLEGIAGKLGGLLKNFHLDGLDSGDILLLLILIFLFLESDDNLELVITLGLLFLFGLFGNEEKTDSQSPPTA